MICGKSGWLIESGCPVPGEVNVLLDRLRNEGKAVILTAVDGSSFDSSVFLLRTSVGFLIMFF